MKKSEFTHSQMIIALYWIWDAFDRSMLNCFLIGPTADAALAHKELEGDAVYMGVRELEWKSGNRPIFLAFSGDPVEKTEHYEQFKNPLNNVPVFVYIYPDDRCIISTDQLLYVAEYFKVPNPYSRFCEVFPWKSPSSA